MPTLLLRLQAPMQSWGISSHFTNRDTGREPSKSGVIGLICASMGRPRDADIADLAALHMGVRVDKEGILQKDFQVAQNIYHASGKGTKVSEISDRFYLSDAAFLVGLEGPEELLQEIQAALRSPHWSLYLGRKAFPPSKPVFLRDGLYNEPLLVALENYPALVTDPDSHARVIIDSDEGEFIRSDVPISFEERRFSSRRIHMTQVKLPPPLEV